MICPANWRSAAHELRFVIDDFDPKVVVWQDEEIGAQWRTRAGEHAQRRDLASARQRARRWLRGRPRTAVTRMSSWQCRLTHLSWSSTRPQSSIAPTGRCSPIATCCPWAWPPAGHRSDHTSVFLNSGPLFHIGNFQFEAIPAFIHGGTNIFVRRVDPEELLDLIADERATVSVPHAADDHADQGAQRRRPEGPLEPEGGPVRSGLGGRASRGHDPVGDSTGRIRPDRGHRAGHPERVRRPRESGTPGARRRWSRCASSTPTGASVPSASRRDRHRRRPRACRLLEPPGAQRDPDARRMVAHHRSRAQGARRHHPLHRHDDPDDQVGGREHVPARGRGVHRDPPVGEGGSADRGPRSAG